MTTELILHPTYGSYGRQMSARISNMLTGALLQSLIMARKPHWKRSEPKIYVSETTAPILQEAVKKAGMKWKELDEIVARIKK